MKNKKILFLLCIIFSLGLLPQCEKNLNSGPPDDSDSDRPEWAGGNTDKNDHIRGNDDSGTTRGGDYGDLYVLLRDEDNGIPQLVEINEEYYVIPLDEFEDPIPRYTDAVNLDVNEEGWEVETENEEIWGELFDPLAVLEVDFGRLNIVRSPVSVLDQAIAEALKVLNAEGAIISQDFCGRVVSTYPDLTTSDPDDFIAKTIDSPRENMAIFRTIMQDLTDSRLSFLDNTGEGKDPLDPLMVAAACFAGGSDKTGFVDVDEVVYINGMMDCFGNNALTNDNELDFEGEPKQYYNFMDPIDLTQPIPSFPYSYDPGPFTYDRTATFEHRYIQFLVWNNVYYPDDENGVSAGPVFSVLDIFEGNVTYLGIGDAPEFTYRTGDPKLSDSGVQGFAKAVDDAVQVLDFVHGDSNIRFLPNYTPPQP